MDKTMFLRPRISEKTYMLSQVHNTFTIDVPHDANRDTIAKAVTAQFNVTVENVRIVNVKGKTKRTVRKGGRPTMGKRSDVKKAYITLKAGDSLPFFTDLEAEAAKEDKKKEKK